MAINQENVIKLKSLYFINLLSKVYNVITQQSLRNTTSITRLNNESKTPHKLLLMLMWRHL